MNEGKVLHPPYILDMLLNDVLVYFGQNPGKFSGEVLHISVASNKRGNKKYCVVNPYTML